jgi:hypothetical protein
MKIAASIFESGQIVAAVRPSTRGCVRRGVLEAATYERSSAGALGCRRALAMIIRREPAREARSLGAGETNLLFDPPRHRQHVA